MKAIEEKLVQMNKATPNLPLHRAHVRRALLASRPEGSNYSLMKKLLPSTVLLLLIFAFSFAFHPENTDHPLTPPTASAEAFLDDVISHLKTLTPEEMAALENKIGGLSDLLKEAQAADDLEYAPLIKSECVPELAAVEPFCAIYDFETRDGGVVGMQSHDQVEKERFEGSVGLLYTNIYGKEIILVVDADLVPVVAFGDMLPGSIRDQFDEED